ncbi:SGNH/GDSL hydrolase family protein [Flavitalea sp. BT771]|uniref:SGNH/GDSL hydrolase family protein n=1 Tax=Flavitalea sp. BT771 TaxID=3063329 RepID=UPI0026E1E781|nr:SGNH/GDSL hydrolase family protein [Flavitalea sp. BT771]MDO6432060.1 SGNH/GDSL hydrolase family protein [Flavitalea sp. BT771]MDV6220969.1 SGNH/GDSL hydrolase family protein [Flavitalea sp. BT771]
MKKSRSAALLLVCLLTMPDGRAQERGAGPFPGKVHRIVFLGNSITYAADYVELIETYFIIHYPRRRFEFINMGLPSETVSGLSEPGHAGGKFPRPDLHERLARVLALTKPDLVFVDYGMNDGIYMPFDAGRFDAFRSGMLWLHGELVKTGAMIIHLTPPVYDEKIGKSKGYDGVLEKYSEWLLQQKDSLGWRVADIHAPMKKYLDHRRSLDSTYAFSQDGVHPDLTGHVIMAGEVLRYLGEPVGETGGLMRVMGDEGGKVYGLVHERQEMMKDAWLTAAGHQRPGMKKGLPLPEAKMKAAAIDKRIRQLHR